ncbi:hypothetical protein PUN28_000725 [Cardiocondyla obscurior]|uniref:Uncharacterized protein n=1 Tax=Cardiocondyla obscurior TaxID=286306 RepID=A0AAW2H174_9HYME
MINAQLHLVNNLMFIIYKYIIPFLSPSPKWPISTSISAKIKSSLCPVYFTIIVKSFVSCYLYVIDN